MYAAGGSLSGDLELVTLISTTRSGTRESSEVAPNYYESGYEAR